MNMSYASECPTQIDQFQESPANKFAMQILFCILLKDIANAKGLKTVLSGTLNNDGSLSSCLKCKFECKFEFKFEKTWNL